MDDMAYLARALARRGGVTPAGLEDRLSAKADRVTEVTVSADGAVTQGLISGRIYHFTGALTFLTLTLGLAISAQPEDYTGPLESAAAFHVEAVGEGLTYQWQTYYGGKWIATSFASSRTDTLTMTITAERDGRQYRCTVTDQYGNELVSDPATLTVGESVAAAPVPVRTPVQYHFDFLSGATAPTVTIPAAVTMPDGFTVEPDTRYEVDILNGFGVTQSWSVEEGSK